MLFGFGVFLRFTSTRLTVRDDSKRELGGVISVVCHFKIFGDVLRSDVNKFRRVIFGVFNISSSLGLGETGQT